MSELKRRIPLSELAALYCEEHQVSDEEASMVFSLSPATIKQARYRLRIPMPGKTRSSPGVAVEAAKEYINSQMTLASFVSQRGINKGSLTCALRRMGYSLQEDRPNRRLMHHKGMYYFRLRQTGKYVFKKLCNDLEKARDMRDTLERKYKA
jgi:hypothetical protein